MNPSDFDSLQEILAASGPEAAIEELCAQLRAKQDYGNLFYALLLKKRQELGVFPIPTSPASLLPVEAHAPYEEAIREAGRTVGRLFLDAGDVRRAWNYYGMLGESEPMRQALDDYETNDDERISAAIEVAFHHQVHPAKGFGWILQRYGICNAITTLSGTDLSGNPAAREACIQQLVQALYGELRERLKTDVASREGEVAGEPGVRELIDGRDWLTAEDCYHVDVSHLTAVVQMSIHLPPGEEMDKARELCVYGSRLGQQFQYPGDPPFEDHYRDYGTYLAILAGDQVEENLDHFRRKAADADPHEVGTYPAQVLVNLFLKLDRPADALAVARQYLAGADPQQISCPTIPDLCQQAGDYQTLAEIAREQQDTVHFLAGLLAQRQP